MHVHEKKNYPFPLLAANIALAVGVVVHFITFFAPYGLFLGAPGTRIFFCIFFLEGGEILTNWYIFQGSYEDMSLGAKMAFCLLPNAAMYFGFQVSYFHSKNEIIFFLKKIFFCQGIYSYEKIAEGIDVGDIGEDFVGDELKMSYVYLVKQNNLFLPPSHF